MKLAKKILYTIFAGCLIAAPVIIAIGIGMALLACIMAVCCIIPWLLWNKLLVPTFHWPTLTFLQIYAWSLVIVWTTHIIANISKAIRGTP